MSETILPPFVEMAVLELAQKSPSWFAANHSRIQRAVQLVSQRNVSRVAEHLYRVKSQSHNGTTYQVNCEKKNCECLDFQEPTQRHASRPFICKHRLAVRLFERARVYQQQFEAEWQRFMSETCTELQPFDHQITVEEAYRILSIHRTNALGGIEGAERWYFEIPQVAAEVAECERVIYLDQRMKQAQAGQEPGPGEEQKAGHEAPQPYSLSDHDNPSLSSETLLPSQSEELIFQPTVETVGFFLCTACRDTGQVLLINGYFKTCGCRLRPGIDLQAAHDPDSSYYFEVADENAD